MGQGYMNSYCSWLLLCKTKVFLSANRSYGMLLFLLFSLRLVLQEWGCPSDIWRAAGCWCVGVCYVETDDHDTCKGVHLRSNSYLFCCHFVIIGPTYVLSTREMSRWVYRMDWVHFNIIQCAYVKHVIILSRLPHLFGAGCIPGFKDYVSLCKPIITIFAILNLPISTSTCGIRLRTIGHINGATLCFKSCILRLVLIGSHTQMYYHDH